MFLADYIVWNAEVRIKLSTFCLEHKKLVVMYSMVLTT